MNIAKIKIFLLLSLMATSLVLGNEKKRSDEIIKENEPNMTQEQWAKMTPEERYAFGFRNTYRDRILANVDGEIILFGELREMTHRYDLLLRKEAKSEEEYRQRRVRLFEDTRQRLCDQYLLLGEFNEFDSARREMIEENLKNYIESQINEQIDRDFDGDRGKYLMSLRARGSNPEAERKRLRDTLLAQEQQGEIRRNIQDEVSPIQVLHYYRANKESFREPEMVEYARIVIMAGASEKDETVEIAAKNLAERLKNKPEEFSNSAKLYSRDDWRSAGGYVGWTPMGDLSKELVENLKKIKNGEVSDLIELKNPSSNGKIFVILKRINHRDAGIKPLSELRPQIEYNLRGQLIQRELTEYAEKLKKRYYLVWF